MAPNKSLKKRVREYMTGLIMIVDTMYLIKLPKLQLKKIKVPIITLAKCLTFRQLD